MRRVLHSGRFFCAPIALVLLLAACSDATLTKVAKGVKDTQIAVGSLEQTVISLNAQKLMSDATTKSVLLVCGKINAADMAASAATRNLAKLDSADRTKLLDILNPVIAAVTNAINSNEVLGITDPGAREKIQAALTAINLTLNTIKAVL